MNSKQHKNIIKFSVNTACYCNHQKADTGQALRTAREFCTLLFVAKDSHVFIIFFYTMNQPAQIQEWYMKTQDD